LTSAANFDQKPVTVTGTAVQASSYEFLCAACAQRSDFAGLCLDCQKAAHNDLSMSPPPLSMPHIGTEVSAQYGNEEKQEETVGGFSVQEAAEVAKKLEEFYMVINPLKVVRVVQHSQSLHNWSQFESSGVVQLSSVPIFEFAVLLYPK